MAFDPGRKRGNVGTPIYVGQTNDFPERVLSRFMKCEKEAAGKGTDCIERRVGSLLHLGIVASYQVLDYRPTRLSSLVSEANWARKCWNAGYDLANRAELQNAGGPPIGRRDALRSWLLKFSLAEATSLESAGYASGLSEPVLGRRPHSARNGSQGIWPWQKDALNESRYLGI